MKGLRTGRVIVIDDKLGEALPLIKALWLRGIPVTFCSGQPDEFPSEPYRGMRLVFLDLHLIEGGGAHGAIQATAGNDGIYVIPGQQMRSYYTMEVYDPRGRYMYTENSVYKATALNDQWKNPTRKNINWSDQDLRQ